MTAGSAIGDRRTTSSSPSRHSSTCSTRGPASEILDVGGGQGVLVPYLAEAGARVTVVDASPKLIAAAKRRHGRSRGRTLPGRRRSPPAGRRRAGGGCVRRRRLPAVAPGHGPAGRRRSRRRLGADRPRPRRRPHDPPGLPAAAALGLGIRRGAEADLSAHRRLPVRDGGADEVARRRAAHALVPSAHQRLRQCLRPMPASPSTPCWSSRTCRPTAGRAGPPAATRARTPRSRSSWDMRAVRR